MRFSVSLRRAAAFPVISLLIQFVGQTLCLLGHWRRHQPVIVVVAAFLYVLAGTRYNCLWVPVHRSVLLLKFINNSYTVVISKKNNAGSQALGLGFFGIFLQRTPPLFDSLAINSSIARHWWSPRVSAVTLLISKSTALSHYRATNRLFSESATEYRERQRSGR